MTFQRFSTQAVRPNDHKNGILQSGGLNVKPNDSAAAWDQLTWILHQSTVYKPSDFFQISKYFNLSPLHGSCHLMFNGIVQNCKKKKSTSLFTHLHAFPVLYDLCFFRRKQKEKFISTFMLLFSILWKKMVIRAFKF